MFVCEVIAVRKVVPVVSVKMEIEDAAPANQCISGKHE